MKMEEFKTLSLNQSRKTSALETKLACSDIKLQQLRDCVKLLKSDSSTQNVGKWLGSYGCETLMEQFDEPQLGVKEMIFIMGGCDGEYSCLSSVDCYSTSRDVVRYLRPISFTRSYSSAAVSNGGIFNFGGCSDLDGGLWYDTVECYNPLNEWTLSLPSSERKGGLASAALHNKIFAFGGSNGDGSLSKVEMFDPALGRWISAQSMLRKRVATAAAELNGVPCVAGGYDGDCFINSAEQFDPSEVSQSKLQSMNTSRASHFIAALNEKLYVLGGFDGTKMVASVEVFDPRVGYWILDGEMKLSRGECFPAVIGETIYTIGGMKEHGILQKGSSATKKPMAGL